MYFLYVWHIIQNTFQYKKKFGEIVWVYWNGQLSFIQNNQTIMTLVFSNCTFRFNFLVHVPSGFFNKNVIFSDQLP